MGKKDLFTKAFEKLLSSPDVQMSKKVDCRGFHFPSFRLSSGSYSLSFQFQTAHFHCPINFQSEKFESDLDFTECTFHEDTVFNNCKFFGDIAFRKCVFEGNTAFDLSKFYREASFSNTIFLRSTRFQSVLFKDKSSFRKTTFKSDAGFELLEAEQEADFKLCRFDGESTFKNAQFDNLISFRESIFLRDLFLQSVKFYGEISASYAEFSGRVYSDGSVFEGKVIFNGSTFEKDANFPRCRFEEKTYFDHVKFAGKLNFEGAEFKERVYFIDSIFSGITKFKSVNFQNPVDFKKSIFNDEVSFFESKFAFFKSGKHRKKIDFEKTILEDAHFWGVDRLESYSFRDSFLLSLNLSGKTLIDCDFTGAVVSGVNTRNWEPDSITLKNTKYVYTDYSVEEVFENGRKTFIYTVVDDSRVPADGNFGEGEHENYTIYDYLKSLCIWSLSLNVPQEFRKPYLDYINFFSDFMRSTEMVNVELRTKREGTKLRIEFVTEDENAKELVKEIFPQYMEQSKSNQKLMIDVRKPDTTNEELERVRAEFEFEKKILNTRLEEKIEQIKSLDNKDTKLIEILSSFIDSPEKTTSYKTDVTSEPTYIVHSDIAGFSKTTQRHQGLSLSVREFFDNQIEELQQSFNAVIGTDGGDGLLFFIKDGFEAANAADYLLSQFRIFNRKKADEFIGIRIILGFGHLFKRTTKDNISYAGVDITKVCRSDQPLKKHIQQNRDEKSSQIWCVSSYHEKMKSNQHGIRFEELGEIELDKNDGTELLFKVLFPEQY